MASTVSEREQLEQAIAAQEGLRGTVDDGVLDVTITALRAQLDALSSTDGDQRRRQATVLFADLQGFTALSEQLDAEVVSDVMNDVWSRIDRIIVEHGGRIDKHIGDAVMGLWGSESSRESDPEQAVRAALDLQQAVAELDDSGRASLVMRAGISTGTVFLGEVATTREFTAMGDTVNVAARLESAAPPGGVLISHDTYRHVRGVFDVQQLEPLTLKGKSKPLLAYSVLRAKPRSFRMAPRGVEGVETRMVGRDVELGALIDCFHRAVDGGHLEVVTVVGDAGVGKSRLLHELENWVELLSTAVYFFKARATATRQAVPYGLFRDLVAARFGILDSDSPASVAAKLREGFAPHLGADEAELVGHWLGFDLSASAAVQRLRGAGGFSATCAAHLTTYLRALSATDPVLVVLEDLHWADPDSLELLAGLVAHLRDRPALVVAATRPPVPEVVAEAGTLMRLERLGDEASGALVDDVLQNLEVIPREVRDLVVERADGNPFFVEELIKMLIDDGVIVPGEDGSPWHADVSRLDPDQVPSTLTGVLESRLDSLVPSHRAAVQHASVIGRVFWDAAVHAMDSSVSPLATATALDAACARELVYRRDGSAIEHSAEFIFKHALLRDVTYETVLLRDRQRLHALAAEWLSAHSGERRTEFLEQIAGHLQLAGDAAAAAELYVAAGWRAIDSGRSTSAKRAFEAALGLWEEASVPPSVDAVLAYGRACLQTGDLDGADRTIAPLLAADSPIELAPEHEGEALYLTSWIAAERADHDAERALLARALPIAERAGGVTLRRVLIGVAWFEADQGDIEAAQEAAQRAHAIDIDGSEASERGRTLSLLAAIARLRGDYDGADELLREGLELAQASGDLEVETIMLGNLGVVRHLVGDDTGSLDAYAEAERLYVQELAAATRLGLAQTRAGSLGNLAQVCVRLGRLDDSGRYLVEAMQEVARSGRRLMLPLCVLIEADLRLADGDVDGALALLGAVQADPSSGSNDHQEIERFLARAGLPDDEVEAGMAAGAGLDVEALAREILAHRELADDRT